MSLDAESSANSRKATLWVGELDAYTDENFVRNNMFAQFLNHVTNVKVLRDRVTMLPLGYGFVDFDSAEVAEAALNSLNGLTVPGAPHKKYRLNWAMHNAGINRSDPSQGQTYQMFVGDLDSEVTDMHLDSAFRPRYPSVHSTRVVMDLNTGRSKGFGFVKFTDYSEWRRALEEMNGVHLLSKPMRVAEAQQRSRTAQPPQQLLGMGYGMPAAYLQQPNVDPSSVAGADAENTTVYVGNLDPSVTAEQLRATFSPCGEIVNIRIPQGKNCGFLIYSKKEFADRAIKTMNGIRVGQNNVRLSWGYSSSKNQQQQPAVSMMAYQNPAYAQYYGAHAINSYAPYSYPYGFYGQQPVDGSGYTSAAATQGAVQSSVLQPHVNLSTPVNKAVYPDSSTAPAQPTGETNVSTSGSRLVPTKVDVDTLNSEYVNRMWSHSLVDAMVNEPSNFYPK